ncbi:NAD(P)/FAD-dependent oxidoreductase [Paramaledivibacter caminithermalis]|jgi:flavin-dependent dehydrogenase|nr:NAD(P)/FAD-dependent oxidoreductase [Paramaledivibacter caminithermalis]
MKIAIVGAGLSGLSCAFELKKYGITPTVFEKRSSIGDGLDYTISNLRIFSKFNCNPQKYYKRKYNLQLTPLSPLRKIIIKGPSNKTIVKGKLGYTFKRGIEAYSMENQLAKQVNLPIFFDTYIDMDDIKKDFDYIVWAAGDNTLSKKLGVWNSNLNTCIRISTIEGNFKTDCGFIWFDNDYAKNTYAYLLPYSKSKANLTLVVNNITPYNLHYYWKKFLTKENIRYRIFETRDIKYTTGFVYPLRIHNIYLVGNAAGLTENILGFGSTNAIESGIMAARSIAKKLDYNKLMKEILESVKLNHELRKFINSFENKDFDKLVSFLGLPVIKQMIYRNPFYKSKHAAQIIKLYNRFFNI